MAWYSQTWSWFEGEWHEGNPGIMGPRSHASWLSSTVFDGARHFDGVTPDMDKHAARVNRSADALGLKATVPVEEIIARTAEGVKKFAPGTAIYVKPMYWADADGLSTIMADPDSTKFCLCLFEAAMGDPGKGFSVTKGAYRRPTMETMPTDSKAGCLYPNNARILREAKGRGFDNALVLDMLGNVAETGTSNIFLAKDGVVKTPVPNGTFLNGITRQRVISLLRGAGVPVEETSLSYADFEQADEIFSSGNYSKVMPIYRIDDRQVQPGPMFRKARELYMDFAHSK
ncbi:MULTISPECIES: branched-chain amino acid aminotransferase [Bosea]|jgi:branched-chain amino acid aminotransferase|uniref:Probable branched-chain-amino-acid aminotransferase n=1 Tax=Bosea rubneri TaxID=3075434 RepID=A0ABU3S7E5_9HYPH|nr:MULTISPECIES: branched-chain amino acid aminotransferase [unclassified Bosea (in: a-proteobacteria)]MDU0340717.1 branched-chain amino acid aminotransferase [Bosea sp. ZW T0_25]HEV7339086.1 branched-chain amino acid aminotransferase [Bosea sp. (in: a-proteobacteria)]